LVKIAPVTFKDVSVSSSPIDTSIPPNPLPVTSIAPARVTSEPFTRIPPLPFVAVTLFSVAVVSYTWIAYVPTHVAGAVKPASTFRLFIVADAWMISPSSTLLGSVIASNHLSPISEMSAVILIVVIFVSANAAFKSANVATFAIFTIGAAAFAAIM